MAWTFDFVIDHAKKPGYKLRYTCMGGPTKDVFVRGKLKNGDTITNFHATNNSTLENDFKLMRKSGMIINSDFVKTKYAGVFTKNYIELEGLFDKASKNDITIDEILQHFKEKNINVKYNESV